MSGNRPVEEMALMMFYQAFLPNERLFTRHSKMEVKDLWVKNTFSLVLLFVVYYSSHVSFLDFDVRSTPTIHSSWQTVQPPTTLFRLNDLSVSSSLHKWILTVNRNISEDSGKAFNDYRCSACRLLLRNPVQPSPCAHLLCMFCADEMLECAGPATWGLTVVWPHMLQPSRSSLRFINWTGGRCLHHTWFQMQT